MTARHVGALAALLVLTACASARHQSGATVPTPQRASEHPVLVLRETDEDNCVHPVTQGGVVDVNSTIQIDLDSTELRARAAQILQPDSALGRQIETMAALQRLSTTGLNALGAAANALAAWARAPGNPNAEIAVRTSVQPIGASLTELNKLAVQGSPLRQRLGVALQASDASMLSRWRVVMESAADEAQRMRDEIDATLVRQGTVVLLGGWLFTSGETRGIHLAGFDSIPKGEFYEVPRYTVVLSQDQLDQLKQIQGVAQQSRQNGAGVEALLRQQLAQAFSGLPAQVEPCITNLRTGLAGIGQPGTELRNQFESVDTLVEHWAALVASLRVSFGSGAQQDPVALLTGLNTDLVTLQSLGASTKTTFQQALTKLQSQSSQAAATMRSNLQTCSPIFEGSVRLVQQARDLAGIFQSASDVNTSSLEFSEKVIRRDIASVSAGTTFSLKDAGHRNPGDHVVVRLALATRNEAPQTVEERQFQIDHVLPYVYTAAAFIFADPIAHTKVRRQFQPAASYSILYSLGSRHSPAYNRLVRFSVGLNFAALDFDKDDVPELGVGGEVTGLVNLLKAGFGYNIQANAPYWFFGVRLPTGGFSLGTP